MTQHKSSFRGKIGKDGQRSDKKDFSYLNLPKGVELFMVEPDTRKVKLDILPYVVSDANHPCRDEKEGIALEGSLWYRRPIKIHRNVGSDNGKFICPTSIGKKCPICEYQKKMFNEGRPKEETVPLYPQRRSLYVVLPDQEGFDEVPYIWDMADTMFQQILIEELKDDPDNEIFPDLEEGKTLDIRLKWKTIGEKGKPFPEATNVTFLNRQPYKEDILDEVPDLDKILKVLTYEELHAKFFELDVEDSEKGGLHDVNDDNEPPARKRRSLREPEPEKEEDTPKRSVRRSVREEQETERVSSRRSIKEEPEKEEVKRVRKSSQDAEEEANSHRRPAKEEELPARSSRRTKEEEPAKGKNKCPFGHKFGVDIDETNDCPECETYDDCLDENEKSK
jgi:hypothetical protein